MGRPAGRKTNVTGSGNVYKRGSGLNMGSPVGNGGGISGRPGTGGGDNGRSFGGGGFGGGGYRGGGGFFGGRRKKLGCFGTILLILLVIFILRRCFGLFSGGGYEDVAETQTFETQNAGTQGSSGGDIYGNVDEDVYNPYQQPYGYNNNSGSYSAYASSGLSNNSGVLNTSVDTAARAKYTKILGNNQDKVTVMVYMCGTDLESKNGAATNDIQEMLYADNTENINLLVYTGGCRRWKNNVVSNRVNQIYRVTSKGLECVMENAGTGAMTDPATLSSYIKWAAKNYPANRYELIFWDHGSGSISGYGYDEKNERAGSMTLPMISQALEDGGVKFDFVGFDACLMATLETAAVLAPHADYMIASEETEPADGWYYTNWLTTLSQNKSVPTLDLAKEIADTYYEANKKYSSYSGITLSVTDIAELQNKVPESFVDFAVSISDMIEGDRYKQVSNARSKTKEFASSSKIDQVDLVNLADNLANDESKELIKAIQSCIKYNITSSNMATAYGMSIYFPYRSLSEVDTMTETYEALGLSPEYSKCITDFASQQTAGQIGGGGSWSPFGSLFGGYDDYGSYGSSYDYYGNGYDDYDYGYGYNSGYGSNYSGSMSDELLMELLTYAISGRYHGLKNVGANQMKFLSKANLEKNANYVMKNSLDPTKLVWGKDNSGQVILGLDDKDWDYVDTVLLNVLYDDGEGYIDLGLDTVYNWTEDGKLIGEYDYTWLAVDGNPVAYYHISTETSGKEYVIKGYIPAFVNDERANLLVAFDNRHEYGYIYGVQKVYEEGETETEAKIYELEDGDRLDFVCDFYNYDGTFENNYYLGESMIVDGEPLISNVEIGADANAAYRITDIYNNNFWTPIMK